MKRSVLWKACTFLLAMTVFAGFATGPARTVLAAVTTKAVIRGSVSPPQGEGVLSLWAAATKSDGSHVYPAVVTGDDWRIEVPAGTYFVEVRWTYRNPAWAGSEGSSTVPPVLEDYQKVGPIAVTAGATIEFFSGVKRTSPYKLSIQAPARVAAGETFTITVKTKDTNQPVAGAEVYLVPRKAPLPEVIDQQSGTLMTSLGTRLGKTDSKGKLEASIKQPGEYLLYATVQGAVPASAGITVEQMTGLRLFTDKAVYVQGEKILLILYNGSSSTITVPTSAPWEIRRSDGTVVFAPVALQAMRNLEPGGVLTWEWTQKDNAGKQVPPGVYLVSARTSAGDLETRFSISGLRGISSDPLPLPLLPGESPFEDVTGRVKWGDPFILALYAKGLIKGKAAGKFAPDDTMSRAEFIALLLNAAGLDEDLEKIKKKEQDPSMFSDVRWNHWAYSYIREALEMGLISRYEYPGGFGPDKPITRMEMAVITTRAMGLEEEAQQRAGDELPFADAHKVEWRYRGYIAVAVEAGVLSGTDDGRIDPSGHVTRRQAAVVVWRVLSAGE